jgi:hypothetical protein
MIATLRRRTSQGNAARSMRTAAGSGRRQRLALQTIEIRLGRLPTDADRERVIDGITNSDGGASAALVATTLKRLAPQWFVVQNAHVATGPLLLQPRHAMSLMRGPMTRAEIGAAMEQRKASRERRQSCRPGACS